MSVINDNETIQFHFGVSNKPQSVKDKEIEMQCNHEEYDGGSN
jgi:hypothetical protein